jgi:molybdate transport system ATP-binding protein
MRVGRMLEHHAVYFPAWDPAYAARLAHAFELPLHKPLGRLSKGLARRVHLTLALAHRPPLLLLDEPTDGLDPVMRDETLGMLAEHVAETGCTVLISTHLVHEVDRLADHLVLIEAGRVVASGALQDLQADPALSVARLPEAAVALDAAVANYDPEYGLITLSVGGATILVPGEYRSLGAAQRVRVQASDVSLARQPPGPSTILNVLPARVVAAEPQDVGQVIVVVRLGVAGQGARLLARVTRKSWEQLGAGAGDLVYAQVKSVALVATTGVAVGQGVAAPLPAAPGPRQRNVLNWRRNHEDQRAQRAQG